MEQARNGEGGKRQSWNQKRRAMDNRIQSLQFSFKNFILITTSNIYTCYSRHDCRWAWSQGRLCWLFADTCDVAFCNKVMTSIGASERRAYSTAFMSSTSSNITASKEPERRAITVSRQGGPLGELCSSSSKSSQSVSQAKWRGVLPSSSWMLQACGYFEVSILMTDDDAPEPAATWSGVLPIQSLITSDSGWSSVILSSKGTGGSYRTHAWSSVMPLNSSHLEIDWVIYLNISGFDTA